MENEIISLSPGFHALLVIELSLKEWLCLQENVYLEDFSNWILFFVFFGFYNQKWNIIWSLALFYEKNLEKNIRSNFKKKRIKHESCQIAKLQEKKYENKHFGVKEGSFIIAQWYFIGVECFNFQMAFKVRK